MSKIDWTISALAFCFGMFVCLLLMSSEVTDRKEQISALQAQIKSMDTRIAALHNQIEDRDKKIVTLQENVKFLEDTLK